MSTLKFSVKGDWKKTSDFLIKSKNFSAKTAIIKYAQMGLDALKEATPKDSGITADSWYYNIIKNVNGYAIDYCNSNAPSGVKVALLLQYGHATRNGGWVEGVDYINPALKPIFDKIAKEAWEEVTR